MMIIMINLYTCSIELKGCSNDLIVRESSLNFEFFVLI